MFESEFPAGTPVRVMHAFRHGGGPIKAEVVGEVESWKDQPTGSWYAHERGGRVRLRRLTLRKSDGEVSVLVIDDSTRITRVEPKAAPSN